MSSQIRVRGRLFWIISPRIPNWEFLVRFAGLRYSVLTANMAFRALSLLAFLGVLVSGQSTTKSSCPTLSASYAAPSVAAGWEARLMVQDVGSVRGIIFDSEGHLLTVSRGKGVLYMELHDGGGTCVNVTSSKLIIQAGNVRL